MSGCGNHWSQHKLQSESNSSIWNALSQVPEKKRTGHCSLKTLRTYENSNEEQHRAVSSLPCKSSSIAIYSQQLLHSSNSTIRIQGSSGIPQSQTATTIPGNVTFNNLYDCTINITQAAPPLTQSQLQPQLIMPNIELTQDEMDNLF